MLVSDAHERLAMARALTLALKVLDASAMKMRVHSDYIVMNEMLETLELDDLELELHARSAQRLVSWLGERPVMADSEH